MKLIALLLLVLASSARADAWISRSVTEKELAAAITAMPEHFEEPTGSEVRADLPKLGLEKGDVVRLVNGIVPSAWLGDDAYRPAVVWLDVARRGKPVAIRLDVKLDGFVNTMDRAEFREEVQLSGNEMGRELAFRQATKAGKPSGVVLVSRWYSLRPANFGDVVRKVNGAAVLTIDDFLAALDRGKDGRQVTIEIERTGQPVVVTVQLTDRGAPAKGKAVIGDGIAGVKPLAVTCYEVPRALVSAIVDAVMTGQSLDGVHVRPGAKDGANRDFQLHVVRPSALAAKLGLADGDVVKSINQLTPRSPRQGYELARKLDGPNITVVIERAGKPITLVYLVK